MKEIRDAHALLRLWGKTNRKDATLYHPLLFHLIDVGIAARMLWRMSLPDRVKERIAEALGLCVEEAEAWVVLVAAQHDIGKAAPAFQVKSDDLATFVEKTAHLVIGAEVRAAAKQPPHGQISAAVLPDMLAGPDNLSFPAINKETADILARITGAHHGTFAGSKTLCDLGPNAKGDADWSEARSQLTDALIAALFPDSTPPSPPREPTDPALVPLLAGLIAVADWIGSAMPVASSIADGPAQDARQYAQQVSGEIPVRMETFGFRPPIEPPDPATLAECFGKTPSFPNAMQRQIETIADSATGAYLLLVEYPMGGGKTEGALYAHDRAVCDGFSSGLYFALPTQATANAIRQRLDRDYLQKRPELKDRPEKAHVQLVHGGASLRQDTTSDSAERQKRLIRHLDAAAAENGATEEKTEPESHMMAEAWFAESGRQALLAPYGVGTIDQSLLGVLQTKHWFVRLFALAGKTVIFDEVDAYDVYMSATLKTLLSWLSLLDCTVILLSATLPAKKRRELANAYRPHAAEALPQTAYPRLTFIGKDGPPDAQPIPVTAAPKEIRLEVRPTDAESLADSVAAELPDGGCVAVLCNTVGRAQAIYRAAKARLAREGWEVLLLHARTPFRWREKREEEVLTKFGKSGRRGADRPEKCILISTQIIEQSLDLDFDVMYSELAPIDLLLQRMGRLFRHERPGDRPAGAQTPRFVLLTDADPHAATPPGALGVNDELIYDRFVRLRTLLALRPYLLGGASAPVPLALSAAIEPLIHFVYDAPDEKTGRDASDPAPWQDALAAAFGQMTAEERRQEDKADACTICLPDKKPKYIVRDPGVTQALYDEDDPRTHPTVKAATRDGEPSVRVICTGHTATGEELAEQSNRRPTVEEARSLLEFAVPVSDRDVFNALMNKEVPCWRKNGLLRFCRRLHFVGGVCTEIPGLTVTLDKEYGLLVEKGKPNR